LKRASFFDAAGAVLKIGWSLIRNTIGKFSLTKSVKRSVVKELSRYFSADCKSLEQK